MSRHHRERRDKLKLVKHSRVNWVKRRIKLLSDRIYFVNKITQNIYVIPASSNWFSSVWCISGLQDQSGRVLTEKARIKNLHLELDPFWLPLFRNDSCWHFHACDWSLLVLFPLRCSLGVWRDESGRELQSRIDSASLSLLPFALRCRLLVFTVLSLRRWLTEWFVFVRLENDASGTDTSECICELSDSERRHHHP